MSGWVPICFVAGSFPRTREQALLVHTGVSRLVKGEDVDVVVLVFLDDTGGIVIGVEGVHEDEGDVDVVLGVQVLVVSAADS